MNIINSSSTIRRFILGTSSSLTTPIGIINERNSTPLNLDVHQPSIRIMWYRFLLIIIIFVTAAGNILVCLAIARERKLQNTTNYFLMSLAIADCLVAILVMPMGMIAEVLGHFPLPHYACIIFATMDVLCCTSSIWHMSTMSMDRYFTIRFPFRYGRNKTRRIMLLKIIAVWAISTAISSPVFVLGLVNKENVLLNGICAPNNSSFKLYGSVFAFYIPFIIMITTYALTMRSLRNVLVNKKKYNRERRRKQTFRPLAQIINQYAEIAQTIRRTSAKNNQTITSITTNNKNNNTILNKTPYTIVTTTTTTVTSPVDSRAQFFPNNNIETNLFQDSMNTQYGSINLTNETNSNNELHHHHNNQHLTISYIKSSGNKKKRHLQQQQQQPSTTNLSVNRNKNDCDMSTVYEITEYSKSTSSTHDVTFVTSNSTIQKSVISNEQRQSSSSSKMTDDTEQQQQQQQQMSNLAIPSINTISSLKEVDHYSTTDINSRSEENDLSCMEIVSSRVSSVPLHTESVSLIIPMKYLIYIIEYILQYYLFIFPYRSHPLAILSSSSNDNEENVKQLIFHQSTSTSLIYPILKTNSRSVSTQTNSPPSTDNLPNTHPIDNNDSLKQRRFPFNSPILPSSSLFTNFFRQSSTHSHHRSRKSSISLGQCSSIASSVRQQYPYNKHSSNVFRRIESEMDHVLDDDHRPRTSSSSSGLLRSNQRHRPLRRRQQYQSHSAYFLTNPNPRKHQPLTSTTNTNSSDSSSVFHRFNPRFFSTISHQQQQQQFHTQRLRDEHIVAANERKALKVLMIIFCVFVTLWTPFFICTFLSAISEEYRDHISSTIWFSITWLGYSSSMANPFIYTIFSDVFRRAFINIIFCRSNDSSFSRQISAKFSYQRGTAVHQYFQRRSPNHEQSGTSTPIPLHHPTPVMVENDATIYVNRCASDSFR